MTGVRSFLRNPKRLGTTLALALQGEGCLKVIKTPHPNPLPAKPGRGGQSLQATYFFGSSFFGSASGGNPAFSNWPFAPLKMRTTPSSPPAATTLPSVLAETV